MKSNIIIPKKIKVGFNPRQDTYTGMLGYVIYHDGKTWRKEPSWEGWRYHYMDSDEYEAKRKEEYDRAIAYQTKCYNGYAKNPNPKDWEKQYIEMGLDGYLKQYVAKSYEKFTPNLGQVSTDKAVIPVEYDNEPLDGFVLNRKAGGYSTGWNYRQTYCRVYDPRGFEFEISIPNLLYILENASSTVGKGLEGKFIYGWEGKDLVLVPENAPEYKEMIKFTELQTKKVSKKELIPGGIYITSQNEKVTYLEESHQYDYKGVRTDSKVLWFYISSKYSRIDTLAINTIKEYTGEIDEEYATHMEKLYQDNYHSPKKIAKVSYAPLTASELTEKCSKYYYEPFYINEKGKYKRKYLLRKYDDERRDYVYAFASSIRPKAEKPEYLPIRDLLTKTPAFRQVISTEPTTK